MPEIFTVAPDQAGQRLDRFLCACLPELSRARLQALIKEGAALVNGRTAKPSHETTVGEEVSIEIPPDKPAEAQAQDIPLDILYEDEHLAVLNKASGMVVHPAHGNEDGTVVNALLHRFGALSSIGGVARPGIVHRLDKETSGCLIVARSDAAHQHLSAQFAERELDKIYLAVTSGTPSPRQGSVQTHLGRDPHDRLKMTVLPAPAGKWAHTDYEVLHTLGGDALVKCTLHTGRTHQIRVHMKHLGHPLLGDPTYSRPSKQTKAPRLMLHAWRLGITHPVSGKRLDFEAPLPPEFTLWLPPEGLG
ncbi:MAG: pseudouridine synthase, RluA family [Verrucomicrobiales bacterium]|nr:pseudouridine synthase, RluA family [Verrucomicrobiales bacterium]